MGKIQTVGGAMDAASLTFCQSHEHLAIRPGKSAEVNAALRIDDPERTRKDVEAFLAAGGSTLVDAQPAGCGRDAEVLAGLQESTGAQIIASTGFHRLIFYPEDHWIFRWDEDRLAELFASELKEGMFLDGDSAEPEERTRYRAGQIKAALDVCGLSPQYEKLFRAAAAAEKETGAALMIHVERGSDPLELADWLEGLGVPAARVIFCHLDRAEDDLAVHREIASRGAYLEYDTIGRFKYHSDEAEAAIFAEMLEAGFADRLLFSLDVTRQRLASYTPEGVGLDYVLREFLPILRATGVSDEDVRRISCRNCRRVFGDGSSDRSDDLICRQKTEREGC